MQVAIPARAWVRRRERHAEKSGDETMNHTMRLPFLALAFAVALPVAAQSIAQVKVTAPSPNVAALTPAQPAPAPETQVMDRLEALGMGDMVRITVFRNPDLTTEARVSERGTILFPMIGEVPVGGLTPAQAGARIADKLRNGRFVVNPEVTVSIAQVNSRQVSVLGNVNKPGRYPLDSVNVKLTDVLATAGGVAGVGSDMVTIVSAGNKKTDVDLAAMFRNGDLSKNIELQPGDTIYVHRAPMVYVTGEGQKGGAYRLEPHMTVMQAIALASGITPRGTERGIKISRRGANGAVNKFDAQLTDPVQPDDVIYVRESLF
jgi:polysaccharide export outer membrane protein